MNQSKKSRVKLPTSLFEFILYKNLFFRLAFLWLIAPRLPFLKFFTDFFVRIRFLILGKIAFTRLPKANSGRQQLYVVFHIELAIVSSLSRSTIKVPRTSMTFNYCSYKILSKVPFCSSFIFSRENGCTSFKSVSRINTMFFLIILSVSLKISPHVILFTFFIL